MFKLAVPILGISNSVAAEEFYCQKLGFRTLYAYRPQPEKLDPCYMGVGRDGVHLVISSFPADGPPGTRGVQIYVEDAAKLREEYERAGVSSLGELFDQDWGNREFSVRDLDGNGLTFAEDKGA